MSNIVNQPGSDAGPVTGEDVVSGGTQLVLTIDSRTAEALAELARRCSGVHAARDGFTSHGSLTPVTLLEMLAEDAGMVVTRPGSWEGYNMAQVLVSHGYEL